MNITPPVVIEILSPDDTVTESLRRFRDYSSIGVGTIVQMDPEAYVAHRFENGSLIETRFNHLTLRHTDVEIPFDSDALFEQLRSELSEATES